MGQFIIFFLAEAIYDLLLLPLIMVLLMPFIRFAAYFGKDGFRQNLRNYTRRVWLSMRGGSFFEVLDSLKARRKDSGEVKERMGTGSFDKAL